MANKESGIVLKNSDGQYFYGLNTYGKSLRQAKIYRSEKWADEAIETIKNKNDYKSKFIKKDFRLVKVEITELE